MPQFEYILEIDRYSSLNEIFMTDCKLHQFGVEVYGICTSAMHTSFVCLIMKKSMKCFKVMGLGLGVSSVFLTGEQGQQLEVLTGGLALRIAFSDPTFLNHKIRAAPF